MLALHPLPRDSWSWPPLRGPNTSQTHLVDLLEGAEIAPFTCLLGISPGGLGGPGHPPRGCGGLSENKVSFFGGEGGQKNNLRRSEQENKWKMIV